MYGQWNVDSTNFSLWNTNEDRLSVEFRLRDTCVKYQLVFCHICTAYITMYV